MPVQLDFIFGTDQVAANDPAYDTPLFRRSRNYLYSTPEWKRVSRLALMRAGWKCENYGCRRRRDGVNYLHVHHIEPVETRPELFLVLTNLKVLCNSCHRTVTMQHAAKHGWAYAFSAR